MLAQCNTCPILSSWLLPYVPCAFRRKPEMVLSSWTDGMANRAMHHGSFLHSFPKQLPSIRAVILSQARVLNHPVSIIHKKELLSLEVFMILEWGKKLWSLSSSVFPIAATVTATATSEFLVSSNYDFWGFVLKCRHTLINSERVAEFINFKSSHSQIH